MDNELKTVLIENCRHNEQPLKGLCGGMRCFDIGKRSATESCKLQFVTQNCSRRETVTCCKINWWNPVKLVALLRFVQCFVQAVPIMALLNY